ncbi:hypothetical protein PHYBLDRAFT_143754 [Phycomyces blakesleeanus NRRL 1555(-)]|uniref:DDE Tnp4 domain-containing protein n=1 Tax=Phycomyces blakesleeanus (strain ATCC 8743b / DSM 1359 / FGSC 10004 / NBRC 33097 / NRRL 1555) TaxID=763407 RepID=A0A162XKY1_PHYB8|nr:hypothetical protein PHYBLDRAFT_143754 [Phycomyces blakesleeanus NRRL 1555(-)]OAD75505.1 hypothetical protein PHYBLDRAFT_143754 [Phycomyces blakesleeanus NRRL 1555(-)]|eukprot:XP_018293545.1 hypothetical protein PHYBLDRAFT_143754 [Phycomyces blakesleeanus NRRL 1555(-)]
MDGKLISIKKPITTNSGNSYADCKGNISMNFMTICDYKKRFIHIATGTSGSLHDACVLKLGDLYQDLIYRGLETCLENTYIIADLAYSLLPQLLTPFIAACGDTSKNQETVPLTTGQKLYNAHLYLKDVEILTRAIMTCCVLHNLYINADDTWELEENGDDDILGIFRNSDNEDGAVFGL